MDEYISFNDIDFYGDDFFDNNNNLRPEEKWPYTPEQVEASEFFSKMDWEGGIEGLYGYGGAEVFPEEIREFAVEYGTAYENLQKAITSWGKERGVVY